MDGEISIDVDLFIYYIRIVRWMSKMLMAATTHQAWRLDAIIVTTHRRPKS